MRLTITTLFVALVPTSFALAGLNTTTVAFQQGANGYTSAVDRYIFQAGGGGGVDGSTVANYTLIPSGTTLAPSGAEQQGLFRFDNIFGNAAGQIPLGAKIVEASLQLSTVGGPTTSSDNTNGPYGVAGLTAPFDSTTTWSNYPANHGAWFEDGTATRAQGEYGRLDLGETQRADIRSVVQQWSDQTLANNGLVVSAGEPGGSDTWGIFTNGSTSVGSRPKLSVTYTTDNVAINSFQRGTNGYTNVDSVRVSSKCNTDGSNCTGGPGAEVTTDGNTIGSMTLQLADAKSAEQFALFRFNDVFGSNAGQAPTDKPVAKAWLVLTTLTSSATAGSNNDSRIPAPVDAYEMARAWTQTSKFSDFVPTPGGPTMGLQSGDGDITQETLFRTPSATNDSEIWFDVTGYAERLRNGAPNNGVAIQARSTDGWQFFMNGSSAANTPFRPRLVLMSNLSAGGTLSGDYNTDTKVDAADYVTWRKNPGTVGGGDPAGYNTWRLNFGLSGAPASPPMATTVLRYDPSPKNGALTGSINNGATTPLPNLPAAPTPTGVTGLTMVRGAGLADGGTGKGLTNGFYAQSWTMGGDVNAAVANNDYYEWGFALDATHTASLSALDLWVRRQLGDAPQNFEVQASLDNFATVPIVLNDFTYMGHVDGDPQTPPLPADPSLDTPFYYMTNDTPGRPDTTFSPSDPIPQINLSTISALQNIPAGSTVKFRLYGWGATTDTGQFGFRINGPKLTGTVSAISGVGAGAAVPEPGSMLLGIVCAMLFSTFHRRRMSA